MMDFEENELDAGPSFSYLDAMIVDTSSTGLSHDEHFGVADLDLNVGFPDNQHDPQVQVDETTEVHQDNGEGAQQVEVEQGNGVGAQVQEDDIHNVNDVDYEAGESDNAGSGDEEEAARMNDEGDTGFESAFANKRISGCRE